MMMSLTGHISIHADVYAPVRSTVQHTTPYTSWVVRLSDFCRDIDLSRLTQLKITFEGSALNTEWGLKSSDQNVHSDEFIQLLNKLDQLEHNVSFDRIPV